MKNVSISINGKKFTAASGLTILEVAKKHSLYVPTLCYHPDLVPNASCRLCLVEVKIGSESEIVTACSTKIVENMEVRLDTQKVKALRKINLEMLISDHIKKCPTCNWKDNCQLLKLAAEFNIKESRFEPRRRKFKIDEKCPSILWDSAKCIECGNCISACNQITGLDEIEVKYRGHSIIFGPKGGKSFADTDCVFCGQCIAHCPSGSLQEKSNVDEVLKALENKKKNILVAQFAPSTRYSIGELFGNNGENLEFKLVAALKEIGFDYVFDINTGADITTIEESQELVDKIQNKDESTLFTSCCPAWVRYVEKFHHDFIPNLTTTKSPAQCLAAAIKSYFAKKKKIDPKKIIIVEIMPCVAKKYEAILPENNRNFKPEVNHVLTVREAARILKDKKIDLPNLTDQEFDSPLAESSGAAAIYGSSGGVMESALRTAAFRLDKSNISRLEFKEVRGMDGIKETSVEIDGVNLNVAVVSGLKNAAKLLKDIKSGTVRYNYVEVMACPGGCLGGGGQPLPVSPEIRLKRSQNFYIDDQKKEVRRAHENKDLQKMYEFLEAKPLSDKSIRLFHRKFVKRRLKGQKK